MGKPLISNAAMRGMYRTMQDVQAAKHDSKIKASLPRAERSRLHLQRESLYAALLSQVHRRDTLVMEGNDPLVNAAMGTSLLQLHAVSGTSQECAGVAAGIALQQITARRRATPRPVVLALLRGFPALTGVLQLVQERDLSLLLIVQGEPESRAETQRRLLSTKVPIMPVDAADAVALCRVLQECTLRARNGWGGAVIHALQMPDAGDPLTLVDSHLQKRGLVPHVATTSRMPQR